MSEARCLPVPKEHLETIWPYVRQMLEPAVATASGKMEIDDILDGAKSDLYLLWVIVVEGEVVAALTTRIIDYPRRRGMAIDWIGGSRMREWITPAMRVIKEHAAQNRCSHLEGYGREAWDRWGRRYGWKQDYVAFRMELT